MNDFPENLPGFFEIARESSNLSFEDFHRKYYLTEQPVVIEAVGQDWPARRHWNADYLFENLSNDPDASSSSFFYWMSRGGLKDDYQTPEYIDRLYESKETFPREQNLRIWIHDKGHISNWHYDTNLVSVFNVQIAGRKEWFLISPDTPPQSYPFSNFAMAGDDVKEVCRHRTHTHFTLNEGDMVYLPPLWFHKVASLGEKNINLNWLFTKSVTNVNSLLLERELERYALQRYFDLHRWEWVRQLSQKIHDSLPIHIRYRWRFNELTRAPYAISWFRLYRRVFKEFLSIGNMLLHPKRSLSASGGYSSIRQLRKT